MFSFGKDKKTKGIAPLSEEEIQKKLYGRIKCDSSLREVENESRSTPPNTIAKEQTSAQSQTSVSLPASSVKICDKNEKPKEPVSLFDRNKVDDVHTESLNTEKPEVVPFSSPKTTPEKDLFTINDVEFPAFDESIFDKKESSGIADSKESGLSVDDEISPIKPKKVEENFRTSEINESIWESNKEDEAKTYTINKSSANIPVSNIDQSKTMSFLNEKKSSSLDDCVSSFKIDIFEFVTKIKNISPLVVIAVVSFIVVALVVFNVWSRAARNVSVKIDPSATGLPLSTEKGVPSESESRQNREVRVTPVASSPKETDVRVKTVVAEPTAKQSDLNNLESFYSMQICVYEDKERTEKLIDYFKSKGYYSFYKKITTRSGRVLFNVYIGQYENIQNANNAFNIFKKTDDYKKFSDSFVKWIKSS